jgi:hypothetical protein
VIGVPSSLPSRPSVATATLLESGVPLPFAWPAWLSLPLVAALLVTVPVFVQAPWVRVAPMAATLFTVPLAGLGVLLAERSRGPLRPLGVLLVGFAGSWLGGSLFWGWFRLHPLWHLPIEAFALPLSLAGLRSRWRLAAGFYLASLLGTAATDAVMALSGVMGFWPQVLSASPSQAPALLQAAAAAVLRPLPLALVALGAALLLGLCRNLWQRGDQEARVAAAALATTLAVDGLFLLAAALAPELSGLI